MEFRLLNAGNEEVGLCLLSVLVSVNAKIGEAEQLSAVGAPTSAQHKWCNHYALHTFVYPTKTVIHMAIIELRTLLTTI